MSVDLDTLNDEEFMQALDDAAYEEPEATNEDTDLQDESEPDASNEAEANEQIDDEVQDNAEDDEDDFDEIVEENSQAENNSEEEPDTTGSDESENNDDNAEAGEQGDSDKKTDELDYKAEYAKILEEKTELENFRNEITGEFIANGKKTRGFTDPKKIIQSQQMAAGLGEKMAAFKPYRPFMNTLKEKGMLDNPEKFNLAMQLLDGDPEALKKQLKEANIDPFEMDMENINYVPKNQVANNIEIALDDVMENATQHGVDSQIREIISNEWDDDSVIELLEDSQNSADLINHMSTGIYDIVQERMSDKRRVDVNQVYTNKPKIEQYREAVVELENEYMQYMQQQESQQMSDQNQQVDQNAPEVNTVEQTNWIDNISNEQNDEYKAKVEQQNSKTNEARRKATSLSKKKRGTRKPKQQVDPLKMDDEAFTAYMDSIILQD